MERSGLRSHLSGTVPISIGLHIVALLLFLIIPLTANMVLPDLAMPVPEYTPVAPMPPPPPVARVRPPSAAPVREAAANPALAPTSAPEKLEPQYTPPGVPVVDAGGFVPGAQSIGE